MPFLGVTTPVITGKFHGTTRSCGARIHNLAGPQCGQNRWVSTGTVHPKMVNPCFLNGTYSPFLLNRPTNYCHSFRSNFVGVFVFIQKTFPKQKRVAFFSQLPPKSTQPTSLKPPGMFKRNRSDLGAGRHDACLRHLDHGLHLERRPKKFFHCNTVCAKINV